MKRGSDWWSRRMNRRRVELQLLSLDITLCNSKSIRCLLQQHAQVTKIWSLYMQVHLNRKFWQNKDLKKWSRQVQSIGSLAWSMVKGVLTLKSIFSSFKNIRSRYIQTDNIWSNLTKPMHFLWSKREISPDLSLQVQLVILPNSKMQCQDRNRRNASPPQR